MEKNERSGLIISIRGPAGAGKTWLAHKIAGILLSEGRRVKGINTCEDSLEETLANVHECGKECDFIIDGNDDYLKLAGDL